jgi:hypothetical protein
VAGAVIAAEMSMSILSVIAPHLGSHHCRRHHLGDLSHSGEW